jgi:hypothetical protein
MPEQFAGMVDTYKIDVPTDDKAWRESPRNILSVYAPWEDINVTQADLDRCDGFDDYQLLKEGKLTAPQKSDNAAYMAGWRRHEKDWDSYQSWREFCK